MKQGITEETADLLAVVSYRGMWVETPVVKVYAGFVRSYLIEVCGLKQNHHILLSHADNVVSYRGMWVETRQ